MEVELPGLGRDDVVVQAQGDELLIRGERRPDASSRPESFHRLERRYAPFARGFRFSEEVDPDRITVEFDDGLLHITVRGPDHAEGLKWTRPSSLAHEQAGPGGSSIGTEWNPRFIKLLARPSSSLCPSCYKRSQGRSRSP